MEKKMMTMAAVVLVIIVLAAGVFYWQSYWYKPQPIQVSTTETSMTTTAIYTSTVTSPVTTPPPMTITTYTMTQASTVELPPGYNSIKIGAICPLTGTNGYEGSFVANGFKLAAAVRNNIAGIPIELIVADATTPQVAATEAERLITQEGCKILVGTYGTGYTMAIASVAEKHHVIYYECTNWEDAPLHQGFKYFFLDSGLASEYASSYANQVVNYYASWIGKSAADLKFGIVYDSWATYVVDPMLKNLAALGVKPENILTFKYEWNAPDYTSAIDALAAANVDILGVQQIVYSAQVFFKQLLASGWKPKIIAAQGVGWAVYDLRDSVGAHNLEGVVMPGWPGTTLNLPCVKEFNALYESHFSVPEGQYPSYRAQHAYAGLDFIFNMIAQTGKYDPDALVDAFMKADIPDGVRACWWGVKFDQNHWNTRDVTAFISQWQGGEIVNVWPPEVATAPIKKTWEGG